MQFTRKRKLSPLNYTILIKKIKIKIRKTLRKITLIIVIIPITTIIKTWKIVWLKVILHSKIAIIWDKVKAISNKNLL